MYVPDAFDQQDAQALKTLAANHPLATLIVSGTDGPVINHIPLLWRDNELHGHIAKANELHTLLSGAAPPTALPATAVFHGPNGYVSPADYPSKQRTGKVVPTWNYAVVHVTGTLSLNSSQQWLRSQIDALTASHEQNAAAAAAPQITTPGQDAGAALNEATETDTALWTLDDAPAPFAQALQRAIVGLVLEITSVQGKFKLSQNRSDEDQQGAQAGIERRGAPDLAALMRNQ